MNSFFIHSIFAIYNFKINIMSNKQAKIYIAGITVVVMGLVFLMYSGFGVKAWFDSSFPDFEKHKLPLFNAIFNSLVFITLLFALRAIKAKKIDLHRKLIYLACTLSTLFLINYVFYHLISTSTKYGGEGLMRLVYFVILLTHIFLAATSFPFILYTAFLGQTLQKDLHRRIAKIIFPIWLYVALTGVVVYLMISPYYS
jgi:putative membrane protein